MLIVQQVLNGLVVGSVYALFALGFTLIFGVHHILNLAHGAVFMCGAFVGLYVITAFDAPFLLAVLLAALAGGALSILLDWVAFRPLRSRGAPEFSAIISSIGVGMVLTSLAQRASGTQVWRYPFGAFPIVIYRVAGLRITLLQLVIIGVTIALVAGLSWLLFRSSLGRQIRAVAINEKTAMLLGADPAQAYLVTFGISGALAGVAGVLIGIAFNSVHFLMGEPYMLRAFVVIVLGGLGSVAGAVIGGLLLGVIQTLTVAFVSTGLSDAIVFSLLFITLLVRPTGFLGTLRREMRVTRA